MKKLALWLSFFTHPLFIPLFLGVILISAANMGVWLSDTGKYMLLGIISVFSILLPGSWILFLYKLKVIPSILMQKREHREAPLLIMILNLLILSIMLIDTFKVDSIFSFVFIVITMLISGAYFLNKVTKVSLHSIGLGGMLGILITIRKLQPIGTESLNLFIVLCTMLLGFTMSARLLLQTHSKEEVYTGAVTGILGSSISLACCITLFG